MGNGTLAETDPRHRLSVKPAGSSAGFVDGAWWPRTAGLAAELPDLVAALAGRLGTVERVTYNLAAWDPPGRRLTIEGRVVRLEGFRSQHPDTVTVIGASGRRRLTLLTVPPGTEPGTARQVLRRAAEAGNVESPEALLAADGLASARQRWEAEGGRLRAPV
ncbi:DUF5994 family protein [Amycolatopsis mongoliensis]|uniref:DUF5994 family protein n=1 Tax=Amycolatopsis mongoliensis TaxID=715475 RepID=A0A9Y2NI84_9PSEU|nr:DUF5994 family protein [Amycolatopsis sp. 4-36]WIY00483.1 DUF5994 family protein [Amycolatopsis sp. 4-36]